MKPTWVLGAVAVVGAIACGGGRSIPTPLIATDDTVPAPPEVPPPVDVDLIADAAELVPGAELRIAARFSIAPGWKIYWSNPGEAGLPTVVAVNAPAGFSVGELSYPAPHAFEGPGGIRSYGYGKEVLLSTIVRVPDDVAGPEVKIGVEATWLACEDTCRRGNQRLELVLPVSKAPAPSPANQQLLSRHLSRVPVPLDRDACTINSEDGGAVIDCAGVQSLELFPAADMQKLITGQLSVRSGAGARLRLSYTAGAAPTRIRGVLRAEVAGHNTYYTCDEALPKTSVSAPPAEPIGAAAL